ncbi:MAG: HEAT repeat domain-containing protein [Spirochaetales bacterium]|nr:HEAT repeat domain-containing protein [Spirochaetales bacterium]
MSTAELLNAIPVWILLLDLALLSAIIALGILSLVSGLRFMKALETCAVSEEQAQRLIRGKYSRKALLRRGNLIERGARKWGPSLIQITGIDHLWVKELKRRGGKRAVRRVLEYSIPAGLFRAFTEAVRKPAYRPMILSWLKEHTPAVALRKIASSCKGEEFPGHGSLEILAEYKDLLRNMTGDQEWPVRYFALNILLYDFEPQSRARVMECLKDTYPLIRKTAIQGISLIDSDRHKLYTHFSAAYLDDPVREVRAAAKRRIDSDFTDQYRMDPQNITVTQCIHVMDLLDPDSPEDENLATAFLDKDDLELRMIAAAYLDKKGSLAKLLAESSLGDLSAYERNSRLLRKAVEVGAAGFLDTLGSCTSPGSMLIAAEILEKFGNRSNIDELSRKVFSLSTAEKKKASHIPLYTQTIMTIIARGSETAIAMLKEEITTNTGDRQLQEYILAALIDAPPVFLECILDTLLTLLIEHSYPAAQPLRNVILKIPHNLYLHRLLDIIKSPRDRYSHRIRFETFRLLAELREPYCIQYILEHLPVLPLHESRQFTEIFSNYDEKLFTQRAKEIFEYFDSKTRSTLMLCLPASLYSRFAVYIKEGLKDPDPEVRIAAVWTIKDLAEPAVLHQCLDLLRDPVERVRKTVSHALGSHGGTHAFKELRTVLDDPNEIASVKAAAIYGLGESKELEASDILLDILGKATAMDAGIVLALTQKKSSAQLKHLVQAYLDSGDKKREKLIKTFILMGDEVTPKLLTILEEADKKLLPVMYDILDKTGYIALTIRRLNHRAPEERKNAAVRLARFCTTPAYRGLVLAARDPNEEVRAEVVKALSYLETPEGKEILAALENDPDKRVRKYTAWAMERLSSEEL